MKKLIILCIIVVLGISQQAIKAQEPKVSETEFRVDGVCQMCKSRIENAAYIKGVKSTEWNKESQMLTVIYATSKTNIEAIHQSIADAGHSTSLVQADSIAYKKLPACCAYQDGVEVH